MKKSFKGHLDDDDVLRIRLSTNDGLTGYKIVKFEALGVNGNQTYENVLEVFSTQNDETGSPRTASDTINFNDPTLLAAIIYQDSATNGILADQQVIFDNMIVNQDIFVTYKESASSTAGMNFYLELEQVKLSKDEAAVATLKDMRAGPDTNFGS
tara:strand:+ start:1673 stop:2137 length:465 start_codon:yes stop_codon:yes gene_type:complete